MLLRFLQNILKRR